MAAKTSTKHPYAAIEQVRTTNATQSESAGQIALDV